MAGFSASWLGNVAQWVSAVATSIAVYIALFKEEWLRKRHHPKLTVRIQSDSPDCIKTPHVTRLPGNLTWQGDAYFVRIWVENTGDVRAEKVQVSLSNLWLQQLNGSLKPITDFLPMNLRWSYSDFAKPEIYADGISPEMGKHCDLARILDPSLPSVRQVPGLTQGQVYFELWLEYPPPNQSHCLIPGIYKLEIKTAASNCEPVSHQIDLNLTGQWFVDEKTMFSKGVGINVK